MADKSKKAAEEQEQVEEDPMRESDADSEAYTQERIAAAEEKLALQQEQAREQFVVLGEPMPEVEIPDPEERPLDEESMSDAEVEALHTQNEIASEGYTPKSGEDYASEVFDSPDINPEAKEFQLKVDEGDEFSGPEAAAKAAATGFNPRTVATSSNPDDLVMGGLGDEADEKRAEETVRELTGKDADTIREEQGGAEDGDTELEQGSGADEVAEKVSKSSTKENPKRISK